MTILVDLAKREWPQNWPDFMDIMLSQIGTMGDSQVQLVMMALKLIIEDSTDGDFMSSLRTKRRNEITTGVHACLDKIVPFLLSTLESNCKAISSPGCPSQGEAVSLDNPNHLFILFVSSFRTCSRSTICSSNLIRWPGTA